jgi:hypothetical protein
VFLTGALATSLAALTVSGAVAFAALSRGGQVRRELDFVRVIVEGDFSGDPAVSDAVSYDVELSGRGDLDALAKEVDRIVGDTQHVASRYARLAPRDSNRLTRSQGTFPHIGCRGFRALRSHVVM